MAIVDTGSLVRASTQLNVTQSTVTARLKSLELELGQSLINRQKSGATLTAAGVRLLRYAQTITDLWGQARQETALPGAFNAVCNMACHPDLWTGLGEKLFNQIRFDQPSVALSIWHGSAPEIARWMSSGLVDLAITHSPAAHSSQISQVLHTDTIALFSTEPDSPIKHDPGYVFVEAGEEFGHWHATTYSDAGTARLNFGTAQLGLDHILRHGGSAYLPARLAVQHVAARSIFPIKIAPNFTRASYILSNKAAIQSWVWLDKTVKNIRALSSQEKAKS